MAKGDMVECPQCEGTGTDPGRRYTEAAQCPLCGGEGTVSQAKADGFAEAGANGGAVQAAPAQPTPLGESPNKTEVKDREDAAAEEARHDDSDNAVH